MSIEHILRGLTKSLNRDDLDFELEPNDRAIVKRILQFGKYFPNEREFLERMAYAKTKPSPKQQIWLDKIKQRNVGI
jgi:hypothetical protein